MIGTAPGTLAVALSTGTDVFARARAALPSLPLPVEPAAPATLTEALQLIQDRQAARAAQKEPKHKHKTPGGQAAAAPAQEAGPPGARVGGAKDTCAYWMLAEVRTSVQQLYASACAYRHAQTNTCIHQVITPQCAVHSIVR